MPNFVRHSAARSIPANIVYRCTPRGFSLIELMLAIAVFSILAGLAIPSFSQLTQGAKLTSAREGLASLMHLGRGMALSQRANVVVCASISGRTCAGNWSAGAVAFVDKNRNRQIDGSERILGALDASALGGVSVSGSRKLTSFGPDGRAGGSNQTLSVCAPGRLLGLNVVISNAGRIRMTSKSCSATI